MAILFHNAPAIGTKARPSFVWICEFNRDNPPKVRQVLAILYQELPRSPVVPPLESCFLRPARPANQRPPSRWAAHSPSSSPNWSRSERFCFPPMEFCLSLPQTETPGQDNTLV
ncbi:hypothetical protein GJAV_G00076620 [Gymnothorax javanicus]|nr:hypothetical protein GJAV_G00076620 [Gymnothorax javanicus]